MKESPEGTRRAEPRLQRAKATLQGEASSKPGRSLSQGEETLRRRAAQRIPKLDVHCGEEREGDGLLAPGAALGPRCSGRRLLQPTQH